MALENKKTLRADDNFCIASRIPNFENLEVTKMYKNLDYLFDRMYAMSNEAKDRGISFCQLVLRIGEVSENKRLSQIFNRMRSAAHINCCKLDFLVRFIAVCSRNYEKIELNTLLFLSQQTRLWVISLTQDKRYKSRLLHSQDLQLKTVTELLTDCKASQPQLVDGLVGFLEAAPGGEALLEIGKDFLPLFARNLLFFLLP